MTDENETQPLPIRPLVPIGFQIIPMKDSELPKIEPIVLPEMEPVVVDTDVSWSTLLLLWLRENIINDILQSQKGVPMEPSKLWYTSKTLWINFLTLVWTFVGPMIGIPTLSPELTVAFIGIVNLILRAITKAEVVIS